MVPTSVQAATGLDVARTAVKRIRGLKAKARTVNLQVTSVGVYLDDPKTGDLVKEMG